MLLFRMLINSTVFPLLFRFVSVGEKTYNILYNYFFQTEKEHQEDKYHVHAFISV